MPQPKARQEQLNPFTKRCKDADIARSEPDDAWFQDRGVAIPTSKPKKIEVFAAHAWAHGCCNFADEPATIRGWNSSLSKDERAFLFAVCQHPTAAGNKESKPARAIRLLKAFPPRPPTPQPPTAEEPLVLGGGSAPPSPQSGGIGSDSSPRSRKVARVRRLIGGFSPGSAAKFWAECAAGPGSSAAAAAAAGVTPAAAAAAAAGTLPGYWTFTPPQGVPAPSPPLGGPLAHFGGTTPAVRRSLDTPLASEANPFLELRPLRLTYGDVLARLGADEVVFNLTGEDDWTIDDRKRFRNATDTFVNSADAVKQGWVAKPPYSLLVNPRAPPPPGSDHVDESDRLGQLLARAAVWRRSTARIDNSHGEEARRLAQNLEKWHDYCTVSINTPLAASSYVAELKQVVLLHFKERQDVLTPRLRSVGLGELIPFIDAQRACLPDLFTDMEGRVSDYRKLSKDENARASVANTEWMLFFHPFFQKIFRVDGAELAPERAAAALKLAAAALRNAGGASAVSAVPPAPPTLNAPPPPYVPLQAPYAYPAYGAYPPPAWAPLPPPHAPPPHWPQPVAARAPPPPAAAAAAPCGGGAAPPPRRSPVGLPCSPEIIGPQLAVWPSPPANLLCRACAGRLHAHFECPARYATVLGAPCPGFDAAGARVPGDWAGQDLQRATRFSWAAYAARHALGLFRGAPGAPVF